MSSHRNDNKITVFLICFPEKKELRTDLNKSKVVVHEFRRLARYVRFNPVRSVNWPCMKVEIYGGAKGRLVYLIA